MRLRHGIDPATASADMPLRTLVWGSSSPGLWNLGGDLELFTRFICAQAAEELRSYAYACVDAVYQNLTKMGLPLLTIALVQGDALGGGFESALTNDVIIAERGSRTGSARGPVQHVPGHGRLQPAVSPPRLRACPADDPEWPVIRDIEELEELGLVDLVVDKGSRRRRRARGTSSATDRRHGTLLALSRVRQRCQPITYEELIDVTDVWVEIRSWPRPSRSAADGASGPGAGAAPCPNAPGAGAGAAAAVG